MMGFLPEKKEALIELLVKLGIKSAGDVTMHSLMDKILNNFGIPDQVIVDPHTYNALKKMYGDNK